MNKDHAASGSLAGPSISPGIPSPDPVKAPFAGAKIRRPAVRDRYLAGLEASADREVVAGQGLVPLPGALVKLLAAEPDRPMVAAVSRFDPSEQRTDQLVGAHAGGRAPLVPAPQFLASAVTVVISAYWAAGTIYRFTEFLLATPFCRVPMV